MKDFVSVVKERRSANKFVQGIEIPKEDFEEIFSLVKYAPSAFNLQHARYVVVTDQALKDKVYEAAHRQYKVKTASAAILVLGDTLAYEEAGQINEGLLNLGVFSKQEYDMIVESTVAFYRERGEAFMQRDEPLCQAVPYLA